MELDHDQCDTEGSYPALPMSEAPRDRPIFLLINDRWIEGKWVNADEEPFFLEEGDWYLRYSEADVYFPADCEPLGWIPIPSTQPPVKR